ncbi:uncharacterized protein FOMMEDRAFT_144281 [Fomitiporia mediterranea MF3/22]|uniref:uncharacterized protein n=1 Tax=Fomitiporia mediterranea (strain MF3/22) TaxID=694068 RepID=UPI0004408C3F|nr:uncharacterized protein FOMMEDRAFT_144281 [Fomitiporia mediterranea MF3/22]EJD08317.1 hypothetical protein FOMMEDRAFT_144281 [Fomitiporia mediterranea MF3/22]
MAIPDNLSLSDEKPLPVPPDDDDSSLSSPTATIGLRSIASEAETEITLAPSAAIITKREHALKELLSSERAYASDLAFIRNVHIPMALGRQAPFHLPLPATPPSSSDSSLRTLSTSSESSSSSGHYGPPMTKDDVRTIFGNITELAVFSDMFSERLQEALGDVLEDGKGEDWVGALFLEIIPQMEPPYMHYITKHPNALKHLNSLPRTPALANYLAQTQNLASSVTHAWDLPSLLIKPVQRLLKYSLLLTTIIEQTPDDHSDKDNLKKARNKMEEVARAVNEGRRRIEVVKEILSSKADVSKPAALQKKLSIGKSNQGGLGRMKSISMGLRASRPKEENNEEAARVAEHERELRRCEGFVREFAKDIVGWAQTVRASQTHLREWAIDFGRTIGISEEQPSEAFDAFMDTINTRLVALCQELEDVVAKELLPELASLLDTSKAPLRLLTVMHTLEPLHNALLNLNYSRNRPTPSLMEASQKYLALRGQLATDLPKYLELLDKGIVMCIRQFAHRQTAFWSTVRDQWGSLWDCLRMEGETNAGCVETLTLWWTRYSEVEDAISRLTILKREKPVYPRSPARSRASDVSSMDYSSSLPHMTPLPNSPSSAFSGSSSSASMRHRSIGSLDSSLALVHGTPPRNLRSSPSAESVPTFYSNAASTHGKSRPRTPEGGFGRMKARSNTSPFPASVSGAAVAAAAMASSSQHSLNAYGMYPSTSTATATTATYVNSTHEYAESIDSRSGEVRGRKSRSSSLSQKLSETLRTPLRRSPSQKSVGSQRSQKSTTSHSRLQFHEPSSTSYSYIHSHSTNSSVPPVPLPLDITPPPNSPSMYYVETIHPCSPPAGAIYMDLPFLTLREGDIFGVLSELGHPEQFEGLCLDLEEGEEDCLLVVKSEEGDVGLALASFLVPVT